MNVKNFSSVKMGRLFYQTDEYLKSSNRVKLNDSKSAEKRKSIVSEFEEDLKRKLQENPIHFLWRPFENETPEGHMIRMKFVMKCFRNAGEFTSEFETAGFLKEYVRLSNPHGFEWIVNKYYNRCEDFLNRRLSGDCDKGFDARYYYPDYLYEKALLIKERGIREKESIMGKVTLSYFHKSLKILKNLQKEKFFDGLTKTGLDEYHRLRGNVYNEIALVHKFRKQMKSCIYYGKLALREFHEMRTSIYDMILLGQVTTGVTRYIIDDGDYYYALEIILSFLKKVKDVKEISDLVAVDRSKAYKHIAEIFRVYGDMERSFNFNSIAVGIAEKSCTTKDKQNLADLYIIISALYQYFGKKKQFLKWKIKYDQIVEEIQKENKKFEKSKNLERISHDNFVQRRVKKKDRVCVKCGEKTTSRCKNCLVFFYCSLECQKSDWKHHKKFCFEIKM